MLSDSPPEKDVQWSDAGVVFDYKFSKNSNLNQSVFDKTKQTKKMKKYKKILKQTDLSVYKIDSAINNFQFNVAIAQFYEVYRYF